MSEGTLTSDTISAAFADPAAALDELNRLDCEDSLHSFVIHMWDELEPETPLVDGWALRAICAALEAVEAGHIRKLLINVPPGFMKSMLTTVFFPAWVWGPRKKGHLRMIGTSYQQDLAVRDNARARDLMQSEKYQRWWGDQWDFKGDTNAKIRYENTKKGFRQAGSTGSALTGHRGDFLFVDDPHSVKSAESDTERAEATFWVGETLPTRFNNQKRGITIIIMQRLHELDVSGFILDSPDQLGYVHLMIPMEYEPDRHCCIDIPGFKWEDPRTEEGELAWPERFDREDVEDLKRTFRAAGGEYAVSGQLQQNPIPREGGMFQKDDFRIIECLPDDVVASSRGWDLAATKDGHGAQTAGVLMHKCDSGLVVISDVRAGRWSDHEVRERIQGTSRADGFNVFQQLPQDPGQAGKSQKTDLARYLEGYEFAFTPESGSKEDRARPLSAQCEAGNVALVRGDWNEAFIKELTSFPSGKLKDKVDASSSAYSRLNKMHTHTSSSAHGGRTFGG